MKTRTQNKFLLLMGLITVFLFCSVFVLWRYQKNLELDFFKSSKAEKVSRLQHVIKLAGMQLETLTDDYSWWDDMISFVRKPDSAWAHDNIMTGLETFRADIAWVFNPNRSLVYSMAKPNVETLIKDKELLNSIQHVLANSSFNHFFIHSVSGLLEVRSAPLQPTSDKARTSLPQGYFVAAELCDSSYIATIADALDADISLQNIDISSNNAESSQQRASSSEYISSTGEFVFDYVLKGYSGQAVANIRCKYSQPLYSEIDSFHKRMTIYVLLFSMLQILLLALALRRWVNLPLKYIMDMLQNRNTDQLAGLENTGTEFGRIGQLVKDFFDQRKELEHKIAEQNKSELALRSSENLLMMEKRKTELILDSAGEGICGIDPQGRITFINTAGARMLGWGAKELIGESLNRFASYVRPDGILSSTNELRVNAPLRDGEVHMATDELFWRKDGSGFHVEYNSAPIDDNGQPAGAVLVFRDISYRIKTEEQLNKLWYAMEQCPVAIMIMDTKGIIEYINPKYLEITGFKKEEVVGRNIKSLISNRHSPEYYNEMWKSLIAGNIWRGEFHSKDRNGQNQWESTFVSPVRNAQGNATHCLAIMQDITERKRAEEELLIAKDSAETANQAKSTFLANMSHEIRTPMNAILGYTQLLARDSLLNGEAKQYISIIGRSGEHLLGIINNILEMSKIEAGRITLNPSVFNLSVMLNDLAAMFRMKAESKKLKFEIIQTVDMPLWILADESKLRQILINLLGNAIKFTDRGGIKLQASAKKNDDNKNYLVFEIIDSGPGIAPEELGKLFGQFEQTESGRKAESGTGLGLAISRQYARLMGGDITVTSSPGKGSVFYVEITVGKVDQEAISNKEATRKVVGLKAGSMIVRALIVDDKISNRDWLSRILSSVGFEVRQASNGKEAIEVWLEWKPELILMDIHMPLVNGLEAAQKIRASAGGKETIIIALTASTFDADSNVALEAGMDDFLRKPFKVEELFEKLKSYLPVEFIYNDRQSLSNIPMDLVAPSSLSPEMLAGLSSAILDSLRDATLNGDIDQLKKTIKNISETDPGLANALMALADQYEYDKLIGFLGSVGECVTK